MICIQKTNLSNEQAVMKSFTGYKSHFRSTSVRPPKTKIAHDKLQISL